MRKLSFSICLLIVLSATTAEAYIGPGAGAGTIAVVLGILASIFLAFVAVLWYPIKRVIKGRKAATADTAAKAAATEQDPKAS